MRAGSDLAIWGICALSAAGVLVRPFRTPEAVWAIGGAVLLVVLGLVPLDAAASAVGKGADVYLFLIGMMLLSEAAREEGLFDAVAAFAVNHAHGSPRRLFLLIYAAGVVVTAFLSNDATAVVMTPAVFAAARHARTDPLPHLFACALVANAASFVLPISNPANLVLYASHTPPLARWLASFALASLMAILATLALLGWAGRSGRGCGAGATRRRRRRGLPPAAGRRSGDSPARSPCCWRRRRWTGAWGFRARSWARRRRRSCRWCGVPRLCRCCGAWRGLAGDPAGRGPVRPGRGAGPHRADWGDGAEPGAGRPG